MINVGDDGNISKIVLSEHGSYIGEQQQKRAQKIPCQSAETKL